MNTGLDSGISAPPWPGGSTSRNAEILRTKHTNQKRRKMTTPKTTTNPPTDGETRLLIEKAEDKDADNKTFTLEKDEEGETRGL